MCHVPCIGMKLKLKVGVDNLLQVQIIHLTQQKNQIR